MGSRCIWASRSRSRPAVKAHPAFLVRDLETLRERIQAAGYRVTDDVPLEGYHRCHVRDPFGNRIELVEPKALMELPFRRLDAEAALPAAQHPGDAGLDLRAERRRRGVARASGR